jgi:hypothetical protein
MLPKALFPNGGANRRHRNAPLTPSFGRHLIRAAGGRTALKPWRPLTVYQNDVNVWR